MLTPASPETPDEIIPAPAAADPVAEAAFATPPRLIRELVGGPDFPKSALGLHVDIGGVTGVVTEIVRQSLKVKTPEGDIQSFNAMVLCKIYGTAPRPELIPPPAASEPDPAAPDEPDAPVRHVITEPDFTTPAQPIAVWARRPDFPKCAYGVHLEITDYTGVVVEIVKQSLKVQSPDGEIRSYNAPVLRRLHGGT